VPIFTAPPRRQTARRAAARGEQGRQLTLECLGEACRRRRQAQHDQDRFGLGGDLSQPTVQVAHESLAAQVQTVGAAQIGARVEQLALGFDDLAPARFQSLHRDGRRGTGRCRMALDTSASRSLLRVSSPA